MAKKIGVHGTDAETGRNKAGSKCPISREQFAKSAPVLMIDFGDGKQPIGKMIAGPREFASGSMGWYAGEKITVMVDGVPVKVQVGINLTVVGSKDLPK